MRLIVQKHEHVRDGGLHVVDIEVWVAVHDRVHVRVLVSKSCGARVLEVGVRGCLSHFSTLCQEEALLISSHSGSVRTPWAF